MSGAGNVIYQLDVDGDGASDMEFALIGHTPGASVNFMFI